MIYQGTGIVSLAMLLLCAQAMMGQMPPDNAPPKPKAQAPPPITTGPEVGQKIPSFRLQDQNGQMRDLISVMGPKGAMVVMFRSADW
jgi:hypothetical protein